MLYMSPFTAATTFSPCSTALSAMWRTVSRPVEVPSFGSTTRSFAPESFVKEIRQ